MVSIAGNTLDFIIGFKKSTTQTCQLPEWLNNTTENVVDSFYNRELAKFQYKFRASDAEKWIYDQLLNGHALVVLLDEINNINANCYILTIDGEWASENMANKPWILTITLITTSI